MRFIIFVIYLVIFIYQTLIFKVNEQILMMVYFYITKSRRKAQHYYCFSITLSVKYKTYFNNLIKILTLINHIFLKLTFDIIIIFVVMLVH